MTRCCVPVRLSDGQEIGPGKPAQVFVHPSERAWPCSGSVNALTGMLEKMAANGVRNCIVSPDLFLRLGESAVHLGVTCGLSVGSFEDLAKARRMLSAGMRVAFLRLPPDALEWSSGEEALCLRAAETALPLFLGTGNVPWQKIEEALRLFPAQYPLVLLHGDGLESGEGALWGMAELSARYEIPTGFVWQSAMNCTLPVAAVARGACALEQKLVNPGWQKEIPELSNALSVLQRGDAPRSRPVPFAALHTPENDGVALSAYYALSSALLPELVMAMVEYRHVDRSTALKRLATCGLPSIAVLDGLTRCDALMLDRFADPALRRPGLPLEDRNVLGMVLARGGSKGLPGKALKKLGGKSLVGLAVEHCLSVRGVRRVLINTDSPQIAEEAVGYGAEALFLRPPEFATDTSSPSLADAFADYWLMMTEGYVYDYRVLVSATHPLIQPDEISRALAELHRSGAFWTIAQVDPPEYAHSYAILSENEEMKPFPLDATPEGAPLAERSGAFSISGRGPFRHLSGPVLAEERLRAHRPTGITHRIPREQSTDVDTPSDLVRARLLHARLASVRESSLNSVLLHQPAQVERLPSCSLPASCGVRIPEKTFRVHGVPGVCHVLDIVRKWFGNAMYLIGTGQLADACATHYKCQLVPDIDTPAGTINYEREFSLDSGRFFVHGGAVFLKMETLAAFLDFVAAMPKASACSVSTPAVHPYMLQWNSVEMPFPATHVPPGLRQNFADVIIADGILEWRTSSGSSSVQQPTKTRGFRISSHEGTLVRTSFDILRGFSLQSC